MRTDCPPELTAALLTGSYEPYFKLDVWDTNDNFIGSTTDLFYFKLDWPKLEVSIPDGVIDTWGVNFKVSITRGIRKDGQIYSISSSRYRVRSALFGDMKTNVKTLITANIFRVWPFTRRVMYLIRMSSRKSAEFAD